jgi:hypothetical protein
VAVEERAAGVSLDQMQRRGRGRFRAAQVLHGAAIGTGGAVETLHQRLSVRNVLPVVTLRTSPIRR